MDLYNYLIASIWVSIIIAIMAVIIIWLNEYFGSKGKTKKPLSSITIFQNIRSKNKKSYSLVLTGIPLPRIDGEQLIDGLIEWKLWIDEHGRPINSVQNSKNSNLLLFYAIHTSDKLYYKISTRESEKHTLKSYPYKINELETPIELLVSPVPANYHTILQLPQDLYVFPLYNKRSIIGRSSPEKRNQPDIALKDFSSYNSLEWQKGNDQKGVTLGMIGLSRRHVCVKVVEDELQIKMEKGKTIVYGLYEDFKLKDILEPGCTKIMKLQPNEVLLIGNYLLRFKKKNGA
ncbi:hypothetical protein GMMP15_1400015 [Candidatus Magnetomoraceae bacterium gMMP-15]